MTAAPPSCQTNPASSPPELDALEGRVALRIASALTESSLQVPHDISERLRFARERALKHAATQTKQRQLAPSAVATVQSDRSLALSPPPLFSGWGRWISAALPVLALAVGLFVIDAWQTQEQALDLADVDLVLLSDDLPPEAYGDLGFAEFSSTFNAQGAAAQTASE